MENGADRGRRGSMYIQIRMPNRPDRPHVTEGEEGDVLYDPGTYNPAEWIQNLLNNVRDVGHKTHSVFSELDVLRRYKDAYEWREAARWVKYEENVEEGGKRWSKPHVASLSMHSLFELRNAISEGAVILDFDCHTLPDIVDRVLDEWIENQKLDPKMRAHLRDVALKGHKHRHTKRTKGQKGATVLGDIPDETLYEGSTDKMSSRASFASIDSFGGLPTSSSNNDLKDNKIHTSNSNNDLKDNVNIHSPNYKPNLNFMRKIPKDAEVASVMVGEVEDLEQQVLAFVRLKEPRLLGDLVEVSMPMRFLVFCFGPKGHEAEFVEMGRCISTMMVDDIFREVAYKCRSKQDFLAGMDEFMEQVTVLPPGEWDPKIRIEPPTKVPSQEFRKVPSSVGFGDKGHDSDDEGEGHGEDPALTMSKIPFNGLYNDIKRKIPHYWSDYKDALHIQCLASFVYVFLGTLTPNVTFGGLLGEATDQYMGVMECIFAAAVTGVLFALFGGQPLNILGSTGPMLVLETIIYNLCIQYGWDFMPMRFWVGMWTVLIIMIIVTFNLSALVKYITRFTEDSFATLIAVIFIVEAFKKLIEIEKNYPVSADSGFVGDCLCTPRNCSVGGNSTNITALYSCAEVANVSDTMWSTMSRSACREYGGNLVGTGCTAVKNGGDVFFLSILLFIGTFTIAIALVDFKRTTIFPQVIRTRISDFAVLIAIVAMVLVDYFIGLNTPKLTVPDEFKPTRAGRGWIVSPFSDKNPWWLYIAAVVPALLSTILIFLDQQITAVIVNRKENKLQKGVGYHLDMFVVAICVAVHSLLGLPWYVAATVSALAHINSLRKESECTAPGEKPTFLGVREQRVTALFIGILSGLAVLITPVLKMIPMPVLYGVFFYMGFSALRGMQFVDRLFLFIQPAKYQPDLPYIRHVQLWRIHLFTFIQVMCLVVLWVVKTIKVISIGFPLLVLATGVVRKVMECFYTQEELRWLDDLLPGANKDKKKEEDHNTTVPYKPFTGMASRNGSSVDIKDTKDDLSKPTFFVSDECELSKRNGTGNTKL